MLHPVELCMTYITIGHVPETFMTYIQKDTFNLVDSLWDKVCPLEDTLAAMKDTRNSACGRH